ALGPGGALRLQASSDFVPTVLSDLRSEPTDSTLVVFSALQTVCDITSSGVNVVFENFTDDPTGLTGLIVLRGTGQGGQVDNWGLITGNVGGVVQATMQAAIPLTEVGVEVEFGPDLRTEKLPGFLRVLNDPPSVNDGDYEVRGLDGTVTLIDPTRPPLAVVLSRPLISYAGAGGLASYFTGALGHEHLRLSSQSELLDSSVEVLASSSAGPIFWDALPVKAVGVTSYFGLGAAPLKVEVGDYLELNTTDAEATLVKHVVVNITTTPSILQLNVSLDVDAGSWAMEAGAPVPWGRVRKRRHDNYEQLKNNLDAWLRSTNVERWLAGFRRLLNPILSNNNPTSIAIADAVGYLYALQTHLVSLKGFLVAYSAQRVEQVDTLLDTYLQQGARRAVDTLVQGQFSAFFGLDQDDASYPGAVQKALREVNIKDLPQNKLQRYRGVELIDSYEEPDFEFDTSDTDGVEYPTPPGDSYDYGSGSAI
ncbi:MAG: hypothetical protein WDA41_08925, partial [Candidatus Neomarinimicrobiota bacterium]